MTDKRIIKTERDIKQGFLELLKTTPFQKLSINQICDQALVSRSTFYAHFQDKYDLLGQLVDEYTKLYRKLVKRRATQIIHQDPQALSIAEIAAALQPHRQALNVLLNVHEDQRDLLANWERCLSETWRHVNLRFGENKQAPDDFASSLESAIVLNYIRWTLHNGMNDAAATLSEQMIHRIYENDPESSARQK